MSYLNAAYNLIKGICEILPVYICVLLQFETICVFSRCKGALLASHLLLNFTHRLWFLICIIQKYWCSKAASRSLNRLAARFYFIIIVKTKSLTFHDCKEFAIRGLTFCQHVFLYTHFSYFFKSCDIGLIKGTVFNYSKQLHGNVSNTVG